MQFGLKKISNACKAIGERKKKPLPDPPVGTSATF